MVDGKEFWWRCEDRFEESASRYGGKLKTYDKKSDLARITGIDDGEEETVLDLTVKKG